MRSTPRRLAAVAATATALLVAAPSTPAFAASGGGCGNVLNVYGGTVKACISATSYGHGIADGYASYAKNQPGCTFTLKLWTDTNKLVDGFSGTCNNGSIGVHPSFPFTQYSGNFHTTLAIAMTGRATVTAYSPGINMP